MLSTGASSIKKLAIRGAIWTLLGYGAGQILRFGSNLVLTRLIAPELFGLMSLVYVFIAGLHLFSDLGISTSVVQSKRGDDPRFLNTAWTLQVIRGVVLWLGCWIVAIPAAQIYNEPRLIWLIPIVGLNTIIAGFNSTALFTLNRHLSVKNLALFEFSGQFVSILAMLTWAWFSPTVWALVVGGLVSAIFQLILSHRLNSLSPNRFLWDQEAVRELISFGKWIFLSTVFTFLATQSDRLILGKLFTLELLGVYGVAFTLSDVPRSLMLAISGKVLYPSYSKLIELPRSEFRQKLLRNRAPILMALAVGLAFLVGLGDFIINLLYRKEYSANASWMFPLLTLGVWPIILTQTVDPVLFALGKPRYIAVGTFLSFLCFAIGIPMGFYSPLQAVGAVLAVSLSNIPPWLVVAWALCREKVAVIKQDLVMTALFLSVLSLVLLGRWMAGFGFPFSVLWQLPG